VEPHLTLRDLACLSLDQSQQVIYDRPIGLRLLYRDPDTGAEHYLVRYPAGLVARWHRHTAAQTIAVIEGSLEANGEVIGPGGYCHFPPGVPMHHVSTGSEECLFLTIFHGPFDVEALDEVEGSPHCDGDGDAFQAT
jgi:quercetin dioxygenase-like cupin family protein